MRLLIEEALMKCRENGKKVLKKDIAARLWEGSDEKSRGVNMSRICKGDTATIKPEWVEILCDMLDCTPQFLFNFKNK